MMRRVRDAIAHNLVPLLFFTVSASLIAAADLKLSRVVTDVLERFFRNIFLVTSLIIPIVAGLGLNFGIVLGAMAGQFGLMVTQNRYGLMVDRFGLAAVQQSQVGGLGGSLIAVVCSIPIAIALGYLTGLLFNRARGREMITGIILGFFANGIYQFLFLILAGPVIPLRSADVLLPQGMGLRVTMNLTSVERALDGLWSIPLRTGSTFWGEIPVVTLLVAVALCFALSVFFRTKLGQDLRAVGQDAHVAEVSGIKVDRIRIIAIILSMVLAAIGQIIFLQNMTVMNTFQSHEQVGFYAIAALLVGGATVSRVRIQHAVIGTFLFHLLIVVISTAGPLMRISRAYIAAGAGFLLASAGLLTVATLAWRRGEKIGAVAAAVTGLVALPVAWSAWQAGAAAGDATLPAQIGEYLREFFAYAIIGTTLALHAWRSRQAAAAG